MKTPRLRRPWCALASVLLLSFSVAAVAEPPSRAARLGYASGTVSFSPAGQPDWVQAAVNRPLTSGDRLWTGDRSRAELQIGGAAIRVGPSTSMVLLNLDDRITQVQLSQGTLNIRVRSLGPRQTFEVATPNLAFTLRRPGDYRIEVEPDGEATAVTVRSGKAEVYGQGASYTVDSRRAFRFYGDDLSDYETLAAQRDDDLDRWSRERDRRGDSSVSARYVSSEVVGYEELDAAGSWRVDATYGSVWTPTRVASGWTPYRDGHWSWVDPWGWTWVDDAPWGYAVSHYGRWANINHTWAWVPGPRRERAVYAPALVAFIGGTNFQVSASAGTASAANVGWFPLAPREIYRPSYPVSRTYFDSINRSNAVIAPTTINNVYNTTVVNNTTTHVTNVTKVTNVVYANQRVAGSVVVVPAQAFVQSQPVAKATVQLPREVALSAPVLQRVSVAPIQQSVQGGAREAAARPPTRVQAVVVRTAPPPAPLPFAVQQAHLAAKPGTPIDAAQRVQLKSAAPAIVAPKVSVVAAAPVPAAAALPPATAPAARSPQERKAAAALAAASSGEARRPGADRAANASADAARADAARADAARADAGKSEAAKAAAAQTEVAKTAALKADAGKAEVAKTEAARVEAAKVGSMKADAARAEAAKADASKTAAAAAATAEASKGAAARAETAQAAEARADALRASKTKAEASRAERMKADPARGEAVRAATARSEAARAEAVKADGDRADAAKAAALQAGNAKAEAAKAGVARTDAARAGQAKAEAVKADAAKARADAVKVAGANAEGARTEALKADASRAEAAAGAAGLKAKNAKAEAPQADAARAGQAKGEAARADAAKAAAAKAAAANAAAAKAAAANAEADRAEAARVALVTKAPPASPSPPKARASGPKSEADAEDDKKGHRP